MLPKRSLLLAIAALCLAGCNNEGRSVGHGPGNADGIGGREDPAAAPTEQAPKEASTVDPEGAMTTPDGTTQDTGATPRDEVPGNQGR